MTTFELQIKEDKILSFGAIIYYRKFYQNLYVITRNKYSRKSRNSEGALPEIFGYEIEEKLRKMFSLTEI